MTTINVYKNSKLSWREFSRTHEQEINQKYLTLLVGKFDKSREIVMKGAYNKLTIVFQPLGLNHFTRQALGNLIEDHFSLFDHFGNDFEETLDQVFETDLMEEKRDILDSYFSSKLVGFSEHRLKKGVQQFLNTGGQIEVNKVAEMLQISRKTLLRLFKSHLSYTPSEFKSIVRFRNAVNIYQNNMKATKLSHLAYDAQFYDQSDLNFHFKVKTGLSPKALFDQIETIAKELYWKVEYVPKVQDS